MASTAVELDPQLIAFVLPGIPESVRMARFYVRATLGFHELDEYADDAAAITSDSLNNPGRVTGLGVVAAQNGCETLAGRLRLMSTSGNKENVGDRFRAVCPLSVALEPQPHPHRPANSSFRSCRYSTAVTRQVAELGRLSRSSVNRELVSNSIQHACGDGTETVGVVLLRMQNPESVTIVVTDSSPEGPAMRKAPADSERGLGLQIVEALSVRWGWRPEEGGKAVHAVLAKKAGA